MKRRVLSVLEMESNTRYSSHCHLLYINAIFLMKCGPKTQGMDGTALAPQLPHYNIHISSYCTPVYECNPYFIWLLNNTTVIYAPPAPNTHTSTSLSSTWAPSPVSLLASPQLQLRVWCSTRCGGGGGGCGHKARLPDMPQSHWACPSPKQRSRDRNARQRSGRAAHVEIHPNIWSAAVHAHRVIGFTHGNVRTIVCECNVIIFKKAFNWAINN